MKIIDSHVHLNLEQFDNDREEVFKRIEEKLDFVVNIGFDLESSEKSVEYANKYPFIYAVIGFHPDEIEGYSDEAEKKIEELIAEENLKEDSKKFIEKSISKGKVIQGGTALDDVLPSISRRGGAREAKKQSVLKKLKDIVKVFVGI